MYTALKTTEENAHCYTVFKIFGGGGIIAFGIYDLRLATAVKLQKYVFPFGFWRDCGSLGRGWDGVGWWWGGGRGAALELFHSLSEIKSGAPTIKSGLGEGFCGLVLS